MTQWKKIAPHSQWNWDDEHRLSRASSQIKDLTEFKLVRDVINAIRELIFNSTVSLQKYKRFLHLLQEKLIVFSRDIEIRFNSILGLLKQIICDYVIVLHYIDEQCKMDKDCQKYPERVTAYKRKLELFEAAQRRRSAAPRPAATVLSNEQHAQQLLAQSAATAPSNIQSKPLPPSLPKLLDIRNIMNDIRNLLQMGMLADYINLFDSHAVKTGGTQWIKCLTIEELDDLKRVLDDWKVQSLQRPKSPLVKKILQNMTRNVVKCFLGFTRI